MDRALFDAVQQKLTDQWTTRTTVRNAGDHLLTGLLFDDAGHRMVPTHARPRPERRLAIRLRSCETAGTTKPADDIEPTGDGVLSIPWQKPPFKRFREILLPHGLSRKEVRPERPERRLRLVSAIARGRRWLDEIVSGSVTSVDEIALRERCSLRHVNMTISLAFLAPKLVRAAVEGRLPRGVNIARLRDAPAEWSRQFEALGLTPQQ